MFALVGSLAAAREVANGKESPFLVARAIGTGAALLPFGVQTGGAIVGAAAFGAGYAAVRNVTEPHQCSRCGERGRFGHESLVPKL